MNYRFFTLFCYVIFCQITLASAQNIELAFGQTGYDFTRLLTDFENDTGITITTAPQEHYDLKAELIKRSGKKRLPDAFIAPADYTTIQSINLLPMTKDWLSPDTSVAALQTVTRNEQILAIPLIAGNHLVLYFNRSAIEQPASSFEEIFSQRESLPANMRLMTWSFSGTYFLIPFLSAFDALPIQDNQLTLDTPQMVNAMQYYWSLPEQGLVDESCGFDCFPEAFKRGEYAYVIDGVWNYKQYQEALRENLGVALLPSIRGNPMKPYFSGHVLAFVAKPQTPAKREALRQFALYLQSPKAQLQLWQSAAAIPANNTALQQISTTASANTQAMIAQLQQSNPIPNTPHMSIVWEALSKGFNRYGANTMTAPEAAALMQHLAQRTVERQ